MVERDHESSVYKIRKIHVWISDDNWTRRGPFCVSLRARRPLTLSSTPLVLLHGLLHYFFTNDAVNTVTAARNRK